MKIGELVQVIKPAPCGCDQAVGKIFCVTDAGDSMPIFTCLHCRAGRPPAFVLFGLQKGGVIEVWRVKRIPPLSELEGVDEKETLHA